MGGKFSQEQQKHIEELQFLIQKTGNSMSSSQAQSLFQEINKTCPWYPKKGSLNLRDWEKIGNILHMETQASEGILQSWHLCRYAVQQHMPVSSVSHLTKDCPLTNSDVQLCQPASQSFAINSFLPEPSASLGKDPNLPPHSPPSQPGQLVRGVLEDLKELREMLSIFSVSSTEIQDAQENQIVEYKPLAYPMVTKLQKIIWDMPNHHASIMSVTEAFPLSAITDAHSISNFSSLEKVSLDREQERTQKKPSISYPSLLAQPSVPLGKYFNISLAQNREEALRAPVFSFQGKNENLVSEHSQSTEFSAQGTSFSEDKLTAKDRFFSSGLEFSNLDESPKKFANKDIAGLQRNLISVPTDPKAQTPISQSKFKEISILNRKDRAPSIRSSPTVEDQTSIFLAAAYLMALVLIFLGIRSSRHWKFKFQDESQLTGN